MARKGKRANRRGNGKNTGSSTQLTTGYQKGRKVAIYLAPPKMEESFVGHRIFRFASSSSFTNGIYASALCSMYLVGGGTSAAFNAIYAFRLRAVRLWASGASGANDTVRFEWQGASASFTSPDDVFSATSVGTTYPAYLEVRPRPMSWGDTWQVSSSVQIFALTIPAETVIDIEIDFVQPWGNAAVQGAGYGSYSAATLGQFYSGYLDQPTSRVLVPVASFPL
jgi:hypothetical protein